MQLIQQSSKNHSIENFGGRSVWYFAFQFTKDFNEYGIKTLLIGNTNEK